MAARAEVKPMTLRLKVIISTNAPPCPATFYRCHSLSVVGLLIIWQNTLMDFVWALATIMIDSQLHVGWSTEKLGFKSLPEIATMSTLTALSGKEEM